MEAITYHLNHRYVDVFFDIFYYVFFVYIYFYLFVYLLTQRIWSECIGDNERVKCVISTITVLIQCYVVWNVCGCNFGSVLFYYAAPLAVFGWWITIVTFLQHHDPDTRVYDDSDWKFVDAAFQTVDRTYGSVIDQLSHNITDGHVVHHLFFTKIPHYHLAEATAALQQYMRDNNIHHLYRFEATRDFAIRAHQYLYQNGFACKWHAEVTRDATGSPSVDVNPDTSDCHLKAQ